MTPFETLEKGIIQLIEKCRALQRLSDQLKTENQQLKAHLDMIHQENTHAQTVLLRYEQLKKTHQQVNTRITKALETLTELGKGESS